MNEQPTGGDGPYVDHPVLADLPRGVRQRIAEQVALNRKIGAIKTLRDHRDMSLTDAKDVIDGLSPPGPTRSAHPGTQARAATLASGKIDKAGTTLTLYRDGTFTTRGMIFTSNPDRLVAFTTEVDSMRRKSVTGRGAAALATGGMSLLAGNNRGVVYVTITGAWSGTKTYTSRNPDDRTLSSIRSLQAAAESLLAAPSAVDSAAGESAAMTKRQDTDIATQLKTLADLHNTGALSDDEFAAAKARLLS